MPNIISQNPYASATILTIPIVTILAFVLKSYGIVLPDEVIISLTAILSFFLGRFTRIDKTDAKIIALTSDKEKQEIIKDKE